MAQNDRNLYKEYIDAYQNASRQMAQFFLEANYDLEYYLGLQYTENERKYLLEQRRNVLTFNKIRKLVNLISGYQRTYRKAFRCAATHGYADNVANQLTQALNHVMRDIHGYDTLSKVFLQGPLKTGFGLISIWHDMSEDPISGDLRLSYVPWTSFFIDPYFTKIDLSDCAYFGRRAWVSREEAKAVFPQQRDEIDSLPRIGRDHHYPYLAMNIDPREKDMHRIDEYWQLTHKEVRMLLDPSTGRWHEWPEDAEEERLQLILQELPQLKVISRPKRTVKLQMFMDDNLFYDGEDQLGIGDYNIVPFLGFFDPEYHDWGLKLQGIIRALRDPQTEANRRRSKMLDIMDSQIHSGWIAEEDSVINPESLYQTGQGKVVWTRRNQSDRVHKQQSTDIPQGLAHLQQQMDQDVLDIAGINEDMLGQVVRGEERSNAILSETRRHQGLLTMHELFDNYHEAKREVGRKILCAIQENYTQHKVSQIIGDQPDPQFFNRQVSSYAIELDEVAMTQTQRQLQFQQLFQLRQAGAPIPWNTILQSAPLENKQEIVQQMAQADQQQQQAAQLEQQKQQLELQDTAAGVQETQSQAELNQARAIGEMYKSRAYADKVEQDRMLRLLELATQIDQAEQERLVEMSKQDSGGKR